MYTSRARSLAISALMIVLPAVSCQTVAKSIQIPLDAMSRTAHAIGGLLETISNSSHSHSDLSASKAAYARDLREYTAVFARGDAGTTAEFERGVSRIAESHGITHWEAEAATPYAIGQGMHEAGMSETQMRRFCEQVGADSAAAKLVLEGWQAGS